MWAVGDEAEATDSIVGPDKAICKPGLTGGSHNTQYKSDGCYTRTYVCTRSES